MLGAYALRNMGVVGQGLNDLGEGWTGEHNSSRK